MMARGDESCPEDPQPARGGRKSTAEERSSIATLAAYSRWAKHDPKAHAQVMQAGLLDSFRRKVLEHDSEVVEPELTRRAECLRKAHMRRLALRSAKVRAARKGAA